MSLDTYSGLASEVATWLRRADLTAEIPTFIRLDEAQLNRRLRARQMLTRNDAFVVSSEFTALPADFLEVKTLRNPTTADVLRAVSPELMDADRQTYDYASGNPLRYSLEGTNLRVSPVPGEAATLSLLYYAAIPALSDSNPTNWLLTSHPDAYLYGTLMQSAPYLRSDDRLQTWSALYQAIIADINAEDRRMGGSLDVQPSTFGAGYI